MNNHLKGVCLLGLFSFLLIICCIIQFGSAAALASWKSIDDNHEKIVEEHFSNLIEHYNPDPDHKISTTAIGRYFQVISYDNFGGLLNLIYI